MTKSLNSNSLTRRKFLNNAAGSAASLAIAAKYALALPAVPTYTPLRGRFLTRVVRNFLTHLQPAI